MRVRKEAQKGLSKVLQVHMWLDPQPPRAAGCVNQEGKSEKGRWTQVLVMKSSGPEGKGS